MIAALLALPRWVQGLAGLALLLAGIAAWDWFDDRAAVRGHEAKIEAKVQARASTAAGAAATASAETKSEVEATNDQARDAAARSDDPLGDGLRGLWP